MKEFILKLFENHTVDLIAILVSLCALGVSIYFSLFTSRPHIKIEIDDRIHSIPSKVVCVMITFYNKSPVAGDIKKATLSYNGNKFNCIKNREQFDFSKMSLQTKDGRNFDFENVIKSLPVTVLPFSYDFAMLCFPVDKVTVPIEKARLKIDFVGRRSFRKTLILDILDTPTNPDDKQQERKHSKYRKPKTGKKR